MMSQGYIDDMTERYTLEAEANELEPLYISPGMLRAMRKGTNLFPLPFLGDYVPPGWERMKTQYFCDTSGFGQRSEAALTQEEFFEAIEPGYGYAVIEAGQFQCYVAQYTEV